MARSHPTANGYTLGGYPDCSPRRDGQYAGEQIFVVGRHTPEERVFNRRELAEASAYSKTVFRTIEALTTSEVCYQAVLDAFEHPISERFPGAG